MSQFSVNLNGINSIVTGAGMGVGREIALALAEAGAGVCVVDLNESRAEAVAAEINAQGGRAIYLRADISNRFQVSSMIEQARDAFGRIEILINTVGIFHPTPLLEIDEWDWRRQIEVNIVGVFFCVQLMGRVMADEGGGVIINLASSVQTATLPGGIAYVSSKSGIVGLSQQASRELAPYGIRVNSISIGNIPQDDMPTQEQAQNLLGRFGSEREAANVVLFLCSDGASFITGQNLEVDGGRF
ncbi:SDR family oxidoreductase [Anaerolineales bacterium]